MKIHRAVKIVDVVAASCVADQVADSGGHDHPKRISPRDPIFTDSVRNQEVYDRNGSEDNALSNQS